MIFDLSQNEKIVISIALFLAGIIFSSYYVYVFLKIPKFKSEKSFKIGHSLTVVGLFSYGLFVVAPNREIMLFFFCLYHFTIIYISTYKIDAALILSDIKISKIYYIVGHISMIVLYGIFVFSVQNIYYYRELRNNMYYVFFLGFISAIPFVAYFITYMNKNKILNTLNTKYEIYIIHFAFGISIMQITGFASIFYQRALLGSVSFPIYAIFFAYSGYRFKLFDIDTELLGNVMENIGDELIILDTRGNIVNSQYTIFNKISQIDKVDKWDDLVELLGKYGEIPEVLIDVVGSYRQMKEENFCTGEISVEFEGIYHFKYMIEKVRDRKDRGIGMMIGFYDITEIKKIERLNVLKNENLIVAHNRLQQHIENHRDLIMEDELKAMYSELNEILGHTMMEVLKGEEACQMMIESAGDEKLTVESIENTIDSSREGLKEIRSVVKKYKQEVVK